MIIDEVNGQRPISARNDFLSRMFAQVQAAGSPVVGEVHRILGPDSVGLAARSAAACLLLLTNAWHWPASPCCCLVDMQGAQCSGCCKAQAAGG